MSVSNSKSGFSFACIKNRLIDIWKNITIEPVYLLFTFNYGIFGIVSQDLYIEKVCRVNLNFNSTICDNIQKYENEQIQVQEYTSTLKMYNTILQTIPGTLYLLIAGPLSDVYGRKPFMALSLLGYTFNNTVFIVNAYYLNKLKAEYLLFECLQG